MNQQLPLPSIERLCGIYGFLDEAAADGRRRVSSRELGRRIGETAHTVRKDIARLGAGRSGSAGYDPQLLKRAIAAELGLENTTKACIVGLGRLGRAILEYSDFKTQGIEICAGFDSDVNKLELLSSTIPLLPAHRTAEYIEKSGIKLGILTVPPQCAQSAADRLIAGGVEGIVNYTVPVTVPEGIRIRHVSVLDELRILTALINQK